MIIVKLMGGLGNQMFQYAFGKAVSNKLNQSLYFDDFLLTRISNTGNNTTPRRFELSLFPEVKIRKCTKILDIIENKSSHFISKLIRRFGLLKFIRQNENEFVMIENLKPYRINIVEGYFQSQDYFNAFSDNIRLLFRFPELDLHNNLLRDQLTSSESVAIHIRRGDYFSDIRTFQYHGILPFGYYKNAIELLKATQSDITCFVFTDDVVWVKENFIPEYPEAIIIEGNSGAESWKDMALMTYAKHHIVSNSSFSWWGAWLSRKNGVKIAPKNWFNPLKTKFDINSIVPENWTIIDC